MTEAAYFSRLSNALRKTFRWWVPIKLALKAASRPSQSLNKRLKVEYQCAKCKQWFRRDDVEVDHVVPCGTLRRYEDIPEMIRLLTPEDPGAFQVLCKPHHQEKTNTERVQKKSNHENQIKPDVGHSLG